MNESSPRYIVESSKPIRIHPDRLDGIIVGWSSEEDRPISLEEFIMIFAPETARKFNIPITSKELSVKQFEDLSDEELVETTCASIMAVDDDVVYSRKGLTKEQLITEVRNGSDTGHAFIRMTRNHIKFLESSVMNGKLLPSEESTSSATSQNVKLPDFKF